MTSFVKLISNSHEDIGPSDPELDAFEASLDDDAFLEGGILRIGGIGFRPREILKLLDPAGYESAFLEFKDRQLEELKVTVFSQFPTPIAYYYYRFEHSWQNNTQRLHLLRDTWEALVRFLHALVMSEIRDRQIQLYATEMHFSHLLSDSMSTLLLNVERALTYTRENGFDLTCNELLDIAVVQQTRSLNDVRNGFSHSAALSDLQITTLIQESLPTMNELLRKLEGLKNVSLMRYLNQTGTVMRRENHSGYASPHRNDDLTLPAEALTSMLRLLSPNQMLVLWNSTMFCLAPCVHFSPDSNGHVTRICLLKGKKGEEPNRKLVFEVVGAAEEVSLDRKLFKPQLDELRELFAVGPD